MTTSILVTVAILNVLSIGSYILSILQGVTKPHRVTRFVLLLVSLLNFLSIVAAHGNPGVVLGAGAFLVGSIVLAFLSISKGVGGATVFDITCGIIAVLGIIGWQLTDNPIVGIGFSIVADFIAYLPAILKTWKHPASESPWFYIATAVSALLILIAYPISSASAFQFYLLLNCGVMLLCIYRNTLFTQQKSSR
jgi:hypothetical protein